MKRTWKASNRPVTKTRRTAKDRPVPYVPTEAKREPLSPIHGPIGPLPVAMTIDHETDRVALRQTARDSDRWALSDLLMRGLAWDVAGVGESGETPLDLARSTLRRLSDELHGMHAALLNPDDVDTARMAHVAFSMASRAEMIDDLCERIDEARKPLSHPMAPPAHEVAAACLTLGGVLGATSTWDRLLRIAERLDVEVLADGPRAEALTKAAGSYYSKAWPSEHGPKRPLIAIQPDDTDRERKFARLLAFAVAMREGFGEVSDDWRDTFADILLDRPASKAVA